MRSEANNLSELVNASSKKALFDEVLLFILCKSLSSNEKKAISELDTNALAKRRKINKAIKK